MTSIPPVVDPNDPTLEPVELHPGLYRRLMVLTGIGYAALLGLGMATWSVMLIPFFNLGALFFLFALIHFARSWVIVDKDEWAAFFFYGRALKLVEAGPHFRPWLLMQLEKAPKGIQQFQAPGEPEEIFHGDEKLSLPPGMVWPIRITTREPLETEKGHLDVQMPTEWSFYVQFQILDFFLFLARVGSFEHAVKMIRDTGEAVLNEFASEMTVNGMIANIKVINATIDNRIRALANKWSMQIYEAKALTPNISHGVATALAGIPIARAEREQMEERAAGTRKKLEEEGAGAASAEGASLTVKAAGRKAWLEAEADGLEAKKKALGVEGSEILAAEVASDAFDKANSILMGGNTNGVAELVATVKATNAALKGEGKKE